MEGIVLNYIYLIEYIDKNGVHRESIGCVSEEGSKDLFNELLKEYLVALETDENAILHFDGHCKEHTEDKLC